MDWLKKIKATKDLSHILGQSIILAFFKLTSSKLGEENPSEASEPPGLERRLDFSKSPRRDFRESFSYVSAARPNKKMPSFNG